MSSNTATVRLDKWLWAARFYKTRSIARNIVDGGKVHYNGQRSKPSKIVYPSDLKMLGSATFSLIRRKELAFRQDTDLKI
jgi:ribosomal 50S subunit-recycling heat shock protein